MLNENKVNITINNKQLTPVAQPHTYKEALLLKADTGASHREKSYIRLVQKIVVCSFLQKSLFSLIFYYIFQHKR